MSRADLLRSLSAPPELIEADLVDQLADASAALARLRAKSPADHDPAWSRHYSQAQNQYHKALNSLLKFRKSTEATPAPRANHPLPSPPPPPVKAASPPLESPPGGRPPLDFSHLNRQQRRQLEALLRDSPERRQRAAAAALPTAPLHYKSQPDRLPANSAP